MTAVGTRSAFRASADLLRYYQAAIVNTVFGYGLYACLVAIGFNIYVAQAVGTILGVIFNYFTYSRYAFKHKFGSKKRFILAYVVNYLLGLGALAAAYLLTQSPYAAGLIAIIAVSVVNYFILKNLVFRNSAPSVGRS